MRVVGVIPAAGYATRLQPLTSSKEVVPVRGRPVMDYVAERMRAAGCSGLRVVTRPEKADVVANARRLGATVVQGHPDSVAESFLLGLEGLADDDVALLGFPDTIWEPADGYRPLLEQVVAGVDVALGLFQVGDATRADTVALDESGAVTEVLVKPAHPQTSWIWSAAAARVHALRGLRGLQETGVHFDALCRQQRVVGIRLSADFVDIGTRPALDGLSALD